MVPVQSGGGFNARRPVGVQFQEARPALQNRNGDSKVTRRAAFTTGAHDRLFNWLWIILF
jgi:hypothetical protein